MAEQSLEEFQQFHLIDDNAELQDGFRDFVQQQGMAGYKKDYNIISVIGSQSSGKSTLLNKLFGTNFKVMDKGRGRQQTTQGIYASKDKDKQLLILDIEGTDAIERGSERQHFAKSTGILALAVSQVLVINIWTNMVGNYEGQQLGLIKTIFEMNLKLFQVDQMKHIIFILRDFHESENLDGIKERINRDLLNEWKDINKPEKFKDSVPNELFHIDYIPLSSFVYQPKEFEEQIQMARQQFTDKENEKYFFKDFDYNMNLPLTDLDSYLHNIWDTIRSNKDINLPNEKEIIAQIRCEAIKKEAYEKAIPHIEQLKKEVSKDVCDKFNIIGQSAYKEAINHYQTGAADYMPKIVAEKLEELQTHILGDLYTQLINQMSQTKQVLSKQLDSKLSQSFQGGVISNLEKLKSIGVEGQQLVQSVLINSIVVEKVWDIQQFVDDFDIIIEGVLDSKFQSILQSEFNDKVDNKMVTVFSDLKGDIWGDLQEYYYQLVEKLEHSYIPIMDFSDHKKSSQIIQFKNAIFQLINNKLKEKLSSINDNLFKKFKQLFRNNNNTPVNWRNLEDNQIEERFEASKQSVLEILDMFKYNKIEQQKNVNLKTFQKFNSMISEPKKEQNAEKATKDDSDLPRLLGEAELQKIRSEFEKQIAEELETARRAKNQTDILGIPKAVWILLIFLGYDDVLRWLSNPFLMTPLIMILGAVALAFSTGNQQLVFTGFKVGSAFIENKVKDIMKK